MSRFFMVQCLYDNQCWLTGQVQLVTNNKV